VEKKGQGEVGEKRREKKEETNPESQRNQSLLSGIFGVLPLFFFNSSDLLSSHSPPRRRPVTHMPSIPDIEWTKHCISLTATNPCFTLPVIRCMVSCSSHAMEVGSWSAATGASNCFWAGAVSGQKQYRD
jgi:hypothetical protein